MPIRGRKPKSPERQLSEGDPRKHGKKKLSERVAAQVKATSGIGECPARLRGEARRAWLLWSDELAVMEMDRRPDAMALEGACVNYARAVEADAVLVKDGIVVEEPIVSREKGEVVGWKYKAHPATVISNRAWSQVRAFCGEFGFTPVARVRLPSATKPAGQDDLMSLLMQPRRSAAKSDEIVQ